MIENKLNRRVDHAVQTRLRANGQLFGNALTVIAGFLFRIFSNNLRISTTHTGCIITKAVKRILAVMQATVTQLRFGFFKGFTERVLFAVTLQVFVKTLEAVMQNRFGLVFLFTRCHVASR